MTGPVRSLDSGEVSPIVRVTPFCVADMLVGLRSAHPDCSNWGAFQKPRAQGSPATGSGAFSSMAWVRSSSGRRKIGPTSTRTFAPSPVIFAQSGPA